MQWWSRVSADGASGIGYSHLAFIQAYIILVICCQEALTHLASRTFVQEQTA